MRWRGAAAAALGVTAGVGCSDTDGGNCRSGQIWLLVDEPESGESIWEVQVIPAPGLLGRTYTVTCRKTRGAAGPGGADAGYGEFTQEPAVGAFACIGLSQVQFNLWPYGLRVRTSETNGAWQIDEWVEVRLWGPAGGGCGAWVIELTQDGTIVEPSTQPPLPTSIGEP
jgi:hypothetical protein